MIVTGRLVYIHMPKTGGTFTTEVLVRLHEERQPLRVRIWRRARRGGQSSSPSKYGWLDDLEPKHGTCHDIPVEHRSKPILSTVRSPFEWYVSQYEFGWWTRTFLYHPEEHPTPVGYAIEEVLPAYRASHPHFPDLSFSEFLDLCAAASTIYDDPSSQPVGLYTHGLLQFYFRNPEQARRSLDPSYFESGRFRSDLFDVDFVETHQLAAQLYRQLPAYGYEPSDLEFIHTLGQVLPEGRGRREDQRWESYYDRPLLDRVRALDWPIFAMFPSFANLAP
jgi:hypothetical protein